MNVYSIRSTEFSIVGFPCPAMRRAPVDARETWGYILILDTNPWLDISIAVCHDSGDCPTGGYNYRVEKKKQHILSTFCAVETRAYLEAKPGTARTPR